MSTYRMDWRLHLINHLYEKTSIILTSNKDPKEWGRLLGDQGIATAILDRFLHRLEVIQFQGESHRLKYRETLFDSKTVQNELAKIVQSF